MPVEERARAKVNLSLEVRGRLPNGYHALESLVVFADIGDRLTASAPGEGAGAAGAAGADHITLELSGPFSAALTPSASAPIPAPISERADNNLVLKAARMLQIEAGATAAGGARLSLEKNLPVAAGLGGGSADAAATLRALARLWHIDIPASHLHRLAQSLGADVLVCLASEPVLMSGIGERLSPLAALPSFWMVLANPGVPVPTGSVFAKLDAAPLAEPPPPQKLAGFNDLDELIVWLAVHGNDLQAPALGLAPEIGPVLAALRHTDGCLLARMSGSGASCFGLYADRVDAQNAAVSLASAHAHWWVAATPAGHGA